MYKYVPIQVLYTFCTLVCRLSSDGRSVYTQRHRRIFLFSHKFPCHLCFASCQWVFVLFAIVPVLQSVANVRWTVRVQLTFHSTSVQNQESQIQVFYKVFLFSHNHVCYFLTDTKPANERRLLYFLIRVVERRLQRRFEARDRVAILWSLLKCLSSQLIEEDF